MLLHAFAVYYIRVCCHSNEISGVIANPPNSAQSGGTPYHSSKLHPGPCSSVGIWRGTDTDTHTHTHTHRCMWPIYISCRLRLTRNVIKAGMQQWSARYCDTNTHTHTHNCFTALFPGPPGWAAARRELLDFMVQGKINRGRHTDHLAGHHSIWTNKCLPPPSRQFFYRPDALPAAQPTASKHWRQLAHSD